MRLSEKQDIANEVEDLTRAITSQLVGKGPVVQGAVIGELLARWVHGHDDQGAKVLQDLLHYVLQRMEQYDTQ
jgi:hypothetical protein